MTNTYADEYADAIEAISENGRPMDILTPATANEHPDSAFDPSAGGGASHPTSTPVIGLQGYASDDEVEGDLISVGQRRYLFDAQVIINEDDEIRDEGKTWPVVAVRDVKPGSQLVLQKVFVEQ